MGLREGLFAIATAAAGAALIAAGSAAGDERRDAQRESHAKEQARPAASARPLRRYVVAAMGDSLTDPRSHGGKYLDYLRQRCPESRFDSYGIGGNMVNQMRKRFARDVLGIDPEGEQPPEPRPGYSHLILLGGINDICSDESAGRTNGKIKADLEIMYGMARKHGMAVIALTLPPWGGFARYYNRRRAASTFDLNEWIKQLDDKKKVDRVVDIFPLLSCGDPEHLCEPYGWPDRVHWSKRGHEVVGKVLFERVFSDCK